MSKPSHSELMLEETKAKEVKEAQARIIGHMTEEERYQYHSRMALLNHIAFVTGSKGCSQVS